MKIVKTKSVQVEVDITTDDIVRSLLSANEEDRMVLLSSLCSEVSKNDVSTVVSRGATKHGMDDLKGFLLKIASWIDEEYEQEKGDATT